MYLSGVVRLCHQGGISASSKASHTSGVVLMLLPLNLCCGIPKASLDQSRLKSGCLRCAAGMALLRGLLGCGRRGAACCSLLQV